MVLRHRLRGRSEPDQAGAMIEEGQPAAPGHVIHDNRSSSAGPRRSGLRGPDGWRMCEPGRSAGPGQASGIHCVCMAVGSVGPLGAAVVPVVVRGRLGPSATLYDSV